MAVPIKTNSKLTHLDPVRIAERGDVPMSSADTLDEFEFLLDSGTHPLLAAQMLGIRYDTLNKLASNHGREGLFTRVDIGLWNRYQNVHGNQYGRAA